MKPIIFIILVILYNFLLSIQCSTSNFLKSEESLRSFQSKKSTIKNLKRNTNTTSPIDPKNVDTGNCYIKLANFFYNLNPLEKVNSTFNFKTKSGNLIEFNLCTTISSQCKGRDGLIVDRRNCYVYAGPSDLDKTWAVSDPGTEKEKLILSLPSGDLCAKGGNKNITYEIQCDKKKSNLEFVNLIDFDENSCKNRIIMKSMYACNIGPFKDWMTKLPLNKYIIAAFLLLFGLFFLIAGMKNFSVTSFFILSTGIGFFINSTFHKTLPLSLPVCFIIGMIISYIIFWVAENLIIVGVTLVLGYKLGNLFYPIVQASIKMNPTALYWTTIVIFCLLSCLIFYYFKKLVVLIATSVIGAYAVIKSSSIIFGNFPDEILIAKFIKYNEFHQILKQFTKPMLGYLFAFLILFLFGLVWQWKDAENEQIQEASNDNDKDKNNNKNQAEDNTDIVKKEKENVDKNPNQHHHKDKN